MPSMPTLSCDSSRGSAGGTVLAVHNDVGVGTVALRGGAVDIKREWWAVGGPAMGLVTLDRVRVGGDSLFCGSRHDC